ncbi:MAG: CAP domain-containing protein [Candidatus Magasanikbacteria bacterium]|nr:CAP domain-containing protein [Candidatus Magasanikbacteria bacterium]
MKKIFKKYFIPHRANNYHPHILHTKRAIFYSLVFLLTKGILVSFVLFLPMSAFVLPDVLAEEQRQIVELTNQARAEKNLPPLVVVSKLDLSAQNKAEDMALGQYFAHTKDNKSLSSWLRGASYNYEVAGENLAVGFSTAQGIVQAWKKSPTHYANLIDPDFKDLGVGLAGGVYNGRATVFIAQHLGAPISEKIPAKKTVGKKSSSVEVKEVATAVATISSSPVTTSLAQASSSVLAGKIKNSDEDEPVIDLSQPTPVDKYIHAKNVLSPLTNIFAISQNIYIAAMVFFAFSLLLSLAVSIRKQRYHIIAQTGGLIALLFIFWKF